MKNYQISLEGMNRAAQELTDNEFKVLFIMANGYCLMEQNGWYYRTLTNLMADTKKINKTNLVKTLRSLESMGYLETIKTPNKATKFRIHKVVMDTAGYSKSATTYTTGSGVNPTSYTEENSGGNKSVTSGSNKSVTSGSNKSVTQERINKKEIKEKEIHVDHDLLGIHENHDQEIKKENIKEKKEATDHDTNAQEQERMAEIIRIAKKMENSITLKGMLNTYNLKAGIFNATAEDSNEVRELIDNINHYVNQCIECKDVLVLPTAVYCRAQ